ncbi:MAG: ORF6N domain-containing protein [Nitrospirota bacterium]|nr:ORF6N domain-containing protein [Nitrospirota bacterium]
MKCGDFGIALAYEAARSSVSFRLLLIKGFTGIPREKIGRRAAWVMLDRDTAGLYGVESGG